MAFDLETVTGSDLTRTANALARVTKKYFVETRTAIESLSIPAAVVCITTGGFAAVGDNGDIDYVRYSGTPKNHWSGIANDFLTRPNLALVKSLDGQWWVIVTQGRKLKPECWGAKADYYVLTPGSNPLDAEQWWSWSINPTPTDNRLPIIECIEYLSASIGQFTRIGGTVQLGYGGYYSSGPIDKTYRSYCMEGMGLSGIEVQSKIIFAAGSKGIRFGSYASGDGRSISTLRNVGIFSLGYGGHTTDAHGIEARSRVVVEGCFINGFGGNGIDHAADVGGSSEASCFVYRGCYIWNNRNNGMELYGGDANAGLTDSCNFVGNYYWGLYDHAFLGNSHTNHHAATNGAFDIGPSSVPRGGPYKIDSANGRGYIAGCYSESDQLQSVFNGPQIVVGGLHAAGFKLSNGAAADFGSDRNGGMYLARGFSPTQISFALRTGGVESNSFISFNQGWFDPNSDFNFHYKQYSGWGFKYGNPLTNFADYSFILTPSSWSWHRTPWISPNQVLLPKGAYLGGTGSGAVEDANTGLSNIRHVWVNDDPLACNYADHRAGDIAIATDGKSLGRLCTTPGVKTETWTSGTTYTYGSVVKTTAGHVYFLDRIPYDPDAWPWDTTPGSRSHVPSTVRATHTSGSASYNEPNYKINWSAGDYERDQFGNPVHEDNYTEHPTRGFYTWRVIDESLYPGVDFTDRTQIVHWDDFPLVTTNNAATSGDNGSWMRNPDNGITYVATAIPQKPTPIYDQTWSMPASTLEPTHTSGSVEYREPNPDIDGSEPVDINGYVWKYQHSNVTPAYARVAAPFFDGSRAYDVPSLAAGASDSFTITITGAQLGDLPSVTCSVDTQGMDIRPRISAANTMTVRVINDTGGTIDLASATWYGRADRPTV